MRFDDRLTTVLSGDLPLAGAAVAQYRQLIDIIAQITADDIGEGVAAGLARVHYLRPKVSESDRLVSVQSLTGRLVSPVLLQYLAAEIPPIASAAIQAARLSDDQWAQLIPALPVRARGFLRNRRDLGQRTRAMLDRLGVYDMALPDMESAARGLIAGRAVPPAPVAEVSAPRSDSPPESAKPGPAVSLPAPANDPAPAVALPDPQSIGEIVKRIEALQEVRSQQALRAPPRDDLDELRDAITAASGEGADDAPVKARSPDTDQFQFQAGYDGTIEAAQGIALGLVYGVCLATPARPAGRGVDAATATTFARRLPIRAGRANLGGAAQLAGEWRIDADPCFDRLTGRFTGYAGLIRRPLPGEVAGQDAFSPGLVGSDGLRQIVHELRTPLNAIMGFSEIIDQQLFGPVGVEYRAMALRIGQDARQLLSGFDDLDTALRLDRNAIDDPDGTISINALADRLDSRVRPLLQHAGVTLLVERALDDATLAVSSQTADRIVPRLLSALIGSSTPGETLDLTLTCSRGNEADITISLPQSLRDQDDVSLFAMDHAELGDAQQSPLLGLGFCLRLVRNLARGKGGDLTVVDHALRLTLPVAELSAESALLSRE